MAIADELRQNGDALSVMAEYGIDPETLHETEIVALIAYLVGLGKDVGPNAGAQADAPVVLAPEATTGSPEGDDEPPTSAAENDDNGGTETVNDTSEVTKWSTKKTQ